jgi:hypothetical protein
VFRNMVIFYGEELSALRPTPKLEDHPLSAVRDCIFAANLHIRRPFLHPQPEDAPCRGDRDPLMVTIYIYMNGPRCKNLNAPQCYGVPTPRACFGILIRSM